MIFMARWGPDARGRLEKAAMELFVERGYTGTTVEEIAARAGLTERTFFRYFVDKREVLFSGSKDLEKNIVDRIANGPRDVSPLEMVASALEGAGAFLQDLRELHYVRARYALVLQHAEIQERELIKMAALTVAVTKALHAHGVPDPTASLAAELGMAAFKIGFERWVTGKKPNNFAAQIRASVDALKAIATQEKSRPTRASRPTRKARNT
jgi:AcrR family transcriptional regulator